MDLAALFNVEQYLQLASQIKPRGPRAETYDLEYFLFALQSGFGDLDVLSYVEQYLNIVQKTVPRDFPAWFYVVLY